MQRAWESELARRIEERTAELRQAQQLALQAIDDVASTVARMREFYRGREPQLVLLPADLNSLANQVLELTRARWSDMPLQRGIVISVATGLTPELPFVLGIESEVREALTNLVGEGQGPDARSDPCGH